MGSLSVFELVGCILTLIRIGYGWCCICITRLRAEGSPTRLWSRDWSFIIAITCDEAPVRNEVNRKAHASGYTPGLCTLLEDSNYVRKEYPKAKLLRKGASMGKAQTGMSR